MYRNTYALIDLDVLANNVKTIKKEYPNYSYYFGVVKGNAYGHGDVIINTIIKAGINYLAVSSLEEALSIRNINKDIPILVLEEIKLDYLDIIIKNNITITISDYSYYLELITKQNINKLKTHLKLDTGMNRIGLKSKEEVTEIINNKLIYVEGIYTHFATSGIIDKYFDKQLETFKYLTSDIDLSKIKIIHLGRSMILTCHEKISIANGVRLGIVMYGFNNKINCYNGIKGKLRKIKNNIYKKINNISKTIDTNLKVSTAFSLYSEVIQIKKCNKGEFIGYGASYKLKEDSYIATVPIGYYDGVNNFKNVVINNKMYKIVGEICMDMLMVLVDETVQKGDSVCLFGNELSLRKVANDAGISAYKLLTGITNRVPRIYKENGKIVEKR